MWVFCEKLKDGYDVDCGVLVTEFWTINIEESRKFGSPVF